MSYVCVMPWVDRAWRDACLATCQIDVHEIDNSITNRGVPRSWNMGIDKMLADDADWLIVMSTAVRWGPPGGMDFLELLTERPDFLVVQPLATFGWHLVAFSRMAVKMAGRFDENFFPGYYEDIDYSIRLQRAGGDPDKRGGFACDVQDAGMAHSIACGITINDRARLTYFTSKWGSPPCGDWDAYHRHPWGNRPLDYWPRSAFTNGRFDCPATETL